MDRTPWNEEWSESVARVGKLIARLFACEVRFHSVETFLEESRRNALFFEQDLVFFHSHLFEPAAYIRAQRPGVIAFPLRIRRFDRTTGKDERVLVGVAVVERLAATDDLRAIEIGEFLQLAVEAKIDAFQRLLSIEQREAALVVQQSERENKNVISLFPRIINQRSDRDIDRQPDLSLPASVASESDSDLLNKPILMIGPEEAPLAKVAMDLFNKTSMWFFVKIEDLNAEAFSSAQAINDLGRMCIFIADISSIPIDRQIRIAEAFSRPSDVGGDVARADGPRLIACARRPLVELIDSGKVLPSLAQLFTAIEVESNMITGADAQSVLSVLSRVEETVRGAPRPRSKLLHLWPIPDLGPDHTPTFH